MADQLSTTKMSSRGQVVIPEEIRERLGLETGTRFVVIGERDVVVLKALSAPEMREFDALVTSARQAASKAGMKRSDVRKAVSRARSR